MKKQKREKTFIIREIEKRGYPLERYVGSLLRERGWDVYPNVHFYDKDIKKDRELDVKAEKSLYPEISHEVEITYRLLIQCKKVPGNAWVFFEGPKAEHTMFLSLPKFVSVLDAFRNVREEDKALPMDLWANISFMKKLHFWKGFFSSGYTEIIVDDKLSNRRDTNLWGSVVSMIRAINEEKNASLEEECLVDIINELKEGRVLDWAEAGGPQCFYFLYPVVVFEGKMYMARFPLKEENLKETNYVRLWTNYRSAYYKEEMSIDIITKQFLPSYLDGIEGDIDLIQRSFKEKGDELIEKIIKTMVDTLKPGMLPKK